MGASRSRRPATANRAIRQLFTASDDLCGSGLLVFTPLNGCFFKDECAPSEIGIFIALMLCGARTRGVSQALDNIGQEAASMLIRPCVATLTAVALVAFVLPVKAACENLGSPTVAHPNRQQVPGDKEPREDPTLEVLKSKQAAGPVDDRAKEVKRAVGRIGVASKITVSLKNGDDLHGAVTTMEDEKFELAEIDLHQIITIEYKDVKKVRSGYGGINLFTGRRTSRPHWVAPVLTIGLLGLLIVPLFFLRD